jgi:hypothetical protein
MCEHCGSRVHETFACSFPPGERHYAFRKPVDDGEVYDVDIFIDMVRITEKRAYGWFRCFTEEEIVELLVKLPGVLQDLNNRRINGDGQVDRGQAGG